jgi:hypothetical protein
MKNWMPTMTEGRDFFFIQMPSITWPIKSSHFLLLTQLGFTFIVHIYKSKLSSTYFKDVFLPKYCTGHYTTASREVGVHSTKRSQTQK